MSCLFTNIYFVSHINMKRQLQITADGSHTLYHPQYKATYHSVHGALQESKTVFIENGFHYVLSKHPDISEINILETGWGTGLNTLLTYLDVEKTNVKVNYEGVEPFPLKKEEWTALNYCEVLQRLDLQPVYNKMHSTTWNAVITLSSQFCLYKHAGRIEDIRPLKPCHLVYFDAFAPDDQPELWSSMVFSKLYSLLVAGGALVTYCSKGTVRRTMEAVGFTVQKVPGPPHKREMIRAIK